MNRTWGSPLAVRAIAGAIVLGLAGLAWIGPGVAAVVDAARAGDVRSAALYERRWELLGRGVFISAEAALLALLLAIPLVIGIERGGRLVRAGVWWAGTVVLLTPPYLYAYAWALVLLPAGVATSAALGPAWHGWLVTHGRAAWCLGSWLAPLAALLVHAGWRGGGRAAWRLARLDGAGWGVWRRAVLPVLAPHAGLAGLVCMGLALTEYSVCHLCGALTWNTEVLAELQAQAAHGQALLLVWPLLALLAAIAAGCALVWPRVREALRALGGLQRDAADAGAETPRGDWRGRLSAAGGLLIVLAPLLILLANLRDASALGRVWRTFARPWIDSAACALGAAAAAMLLAIAAVHTAATARAWSTRSALVLLIVMAGVGMVAPPALVGDALLAAYAPVALLADHWPIVCVALVARFGVAVLLAQRLAAAAVTDELREAARVDGASAGQAFARVELPLTLPAIAGAGAAVALLGFTEVATTSLVQPPGVGSLALTLLNQIHFGRNDEVIAACLIVAAAAALAAVASWGACVRRGR
jgi:ABC-type Fe3+ transport system permease subunit